MVTTADGAPVHAASNLPLGLERRVIIWQIEIEITNLMEQNLI
jgi:hypothetical protein